MKYAFTIVRTRGQRDEVVYLDYLKRFLGNNPSAKITECYFEKTRGLHCHGVVESPNLLGYSDFVNEESQRGWSIKVKNVYFENGWKRYITKDGGNNRVIRVLRAEGDCLRETEPASVEGGGACTEDTESDDIIDFDARTMETYRKLKRCRIV